MSNKLYIFNDEIKYIYDIYFIIQLKCKFLLKL